MAPGVEGAALVSRRAWIVGGGAVATAAIVAAVLVAVLGGRTSHVLSPRPEGISLRASLAPRSALFGDTLVAQVDVALDRREIRPGSVKLLGVLGPYIPAGPPAESRRELGPLTMIRYRLRLECLVIKCLPEHPEVHGRQLYPVGPMRLVYTRVNGDVGALVVRWPLVEVASRMSPLDMALLTPIDQPPFRATLTPPPVTWRISPTLLLALLAAGAALLLSASGLLVLRFGPARREAIVAEPEPAPTPVPVRELTALERALVLLERARERGGVPEQRKALENLAGELRRSGERKLANSATALAWAERPPPADATGSLAAAVQRRIAEGVNGHAAAS